MSVQLIRHRFTVDEYHEIARAGVLRDDDRVELIDGEVVDMTPIGLRHTAAVNVLTRWLVTGCGQRAIVQVQGPVRLGPHWEPQPDLVLLAPREDFYRESPATAAAALLVVEVADTSLTYDRTVKLPMYARSGVREAWLVDLSRDRVEVHQEPGPDGYRRVEVRERGGRLVPGAFPDLSFTVDQLLG